MPYAIWNSKYKKWLYGTDFRCFPRRQILDDDTPMLWRWEEQAQYEYTHRNCGKEYKIVMVQVESICEVSKEQEHGDRADRC